MKLLAAIFAFFIPLIVQAQSVDSQNLTVQGLGISPFLIETTIEPGKEQLQHITLTNTTSAPLPITISINDFVPSGEHGQASFLLANETSDPRFSLSTWIKIVQQPAFTIPPHGQTQVVFSITPPLDAEVGTHYGGLLFAYHPLSNSNTNVSVTEKAGTLILAKFGKVVEKGSITDFTAESSLGFSKTNFLLSFYNQGNAHIKPKGEIHIENMFGQEVASLPVNRDANIVLPESERNFENTWLPGWRFGRYKATAILFFGTPKLEVRNEVVFWIIPWQRILFVLFVFMIAIWLAVFAIRRYNSWLLRRKTHKHK